jgi:hypothetical protein
MAKSDRILSYFPAFYTAADPEKLICEVVRLIAKPLEEVDTALFRIQRAHRLQVNEQTEDIIRLAAALNLTAFHFEDILTDEALDYSLRLALMRERVERIANIHLKGLGTPWAVLEGAAIFLNVAIVPDRSGGPLITHIDGENFSHRATIEFTQMPERPRERIYLHENPIRRKKIEPTERWPMDFWIVANQNVETSQVKLVIKGIGERTVLPSLFSPLSEEGLLFNGLIPDGKMLVIDQINGAMLEGQPVDEWLIYFKGGIFDFSGPNGSGYAIQQGDSPTPFDGDLEKIVSHPFRKRVPIPLAPSGQSEWRFKVAEGVYDGNIFDYSVYVTDPDPIGIYDKDNNFDACLFDFPASGLVGMGWDERIPCSFKMLLPPSESLPKSKEVEPREGAEEGESRQQTINHLSRVGNILPYFKAAGIRAFVDVAKDSWILGESIIRSSVVAEGEGVDSHSTRLQNQKADILVPLDTSL